MDEETNEAAYFDFLTAREAALQAAVGALLVDNVPVEHLRIIAASKSEVIALAAKVALYHRGAAYPAAAGRAGTRNG